jgi:hypothetical protein
LQYLAPYRHFPGGVSPQAMAYNFAKRTQVAQTAEGQKPLQLSPMVIDSQPGLMLKSWADDEGQQGRLLEAKAFGIPGDAPKLEQLLASIKPDQKPADVDAATLAQFRYERGVRLSQDARREYRRHLADPNYENRITVYVSHLADLTSLEQISTADRDYLSATLATGEERNRLLQSARDHYYHGLLSVERTILEFYTEMAVFNDPTFPKDVMAQLRAHSLKDELVDPTFTAAMMLVDKMNLTDNNEERNDYRNTILRCRTRIAVIDQALH